MQEWKHTSLFVLTYNTEIQIQNHRSLDSPWSHHVFQVQKEEEAKRRKIERQVLLREIAAREAEEKRRTEVETKLQKMHEDMEKRGQELQDALATIQKLQRQLEETQASLV